MHILTKTEFKKYISSSEKVEEVFSKQSKYHCVVGDVEMYRSLLDTDESAVSSIPHKILVVRKDEYLKADFFQRINPSAILDIAELESVSLKIENFKKDNQKKEQALQARVNVETKRSELEKLNEFLSYQDKERSTALKIFHNEEQSKKQYEKQLLFFLDFINSNYSKSSFLDELLQYIWTEIKKIGYFYQLGIIIQFEGDNQAVLFQYDDRKYYSQKNIFFTVNEDTDSLQLASYLANIYQRPVGKIISWKESNKGMDSSTMSKVQFFLYLETQGKEYNSAQVSTFITDRLSILSLIVSRWVTEESEKNLLKQWKNTFRAYKDPIQVVDEELNIIQSNSLQNVGKCYKILADRDQQCENCPLISLENKNQSFVEIKNKQYEVHSSQFLVDKKYYLLFYDDVTQMNLLKSQLIQSEKMSTIGNLANHLAHELNNPLTGLKLTTEYLVSEIKSQPSEPASVNLVNDLNEVLKATVRSEMIIKDLVDFSSETAKEMQQIDFSIILKKTITLLKSVLRTNRVFIDVKSHFVQAQPVYLQQVIFNLIKNACEAMGANGSIKIYHGSKESGFSDFIIEDNGPGISETAQTHLFKPFFTTKKEGEGTGLGLYLCASLMNKMNGELIYDKKFKLGSRFILRFRD